MKSISVMEIHVSNCTDHKTLEMHTSFLKFYYRTKLCVTRILQA